MHRLPVIFRTEDKRPRHDRVLVHEHRKAAIVALDCDRVALPHRNIFLLHLLGLGRVIKNVGHLEQARLYLGIGCNGRRCRGDGGSLIKHKVLGRDATQLTQEARRKGCLWAERLQRLLHALQPLHVLLVRGKHAGVLGERRLALRLGPGRRSRRAPVQNQPQHARMAGLRDKCFGECHGRGRVRDAGCWAYGIWSPASVAAASWAGGAPAGRSWTARPLVELMSICRCSCGRPDALG